MNAMKTSEADDVTVYVIGESLPDERNAPEGVQDGLPQILSPLDPRHGVFPNHIACPIFNVFRFADPSEFPTLKKIANKLMCEGYRLNVFTGNPRANNAVLTASIQDLIRNHIPKTNKLHIVVGYYAIVGILWHMSGTEDFQFFFNQMRNSFNGEIKKKQTIRHGHLSRQLLQYEWDTLQGVIGRERLGDLEKNFLSKCVLLPHNEIYQNKPFGKLQNLFMRGLLDTVVTPPSYQDVQGKIILEKLRRLNEKININCIQF